MQYRIASLKHTYTWSEHIVWWGVDFRGYTPVVGECCGAYNEEDVIEWGLNRGDDCIAVPVEDVALWLSPEPYMPGGMGRAYDQRGPVVKNNPMNWGLLSEARMSFGRRVEIVRPNYLRGTDTFIYGEQ